MKILTITAIIALPLLALGQTTEPQQTQAQTKETQTTAPVKGKKKHAQARSQPEAKPETATETHGQTKVQGSAQDVNRTESGTRSSTSTSTGASQTNVGSTSQTTTVNKQEFKSSHTEVFSLGRHPKEFFVQRFGASHFRLIGNTYFVFVDGCWVAVDVDGFVYTERVICAGDPDFIVVE
jgi:cytoskeletal protein RodZ